MQASTNGHNYNIEFLENAILINEREKSFELKKIDETSFSVIIDGHQRMCYVDHIDVENKQISLIINQKLISIEIKTEMDILLEKMGMGAVAKKKIDDIKSPMPGLILNILVENGQVVKKGDTLMILEAMKMENNLKANADGVIDKVLVSPKQVVEKGEKLIIFEN